MPGDSRYAMMMSGKGKIRKFTPSQRLPPGRKSMQSHIKRANFVVNCMVNCLDHVDSTYRQPNPLNYGWKLDDRVLQPLWYTGAVLPNDDEIIKLTKGGKLEEQQEPELTTPEIPRELLIGYKWISDSDRRLPIAHQAKNVLMRPIKRLINGNQVQRRDNRVGDGQKDSADVVRKQLNYNIIITLLKYLSCCS